MNKTSQLVKIGKNLLRVPAGHPMPSYRIRWSSFDRPLQLLADALVNSTGLRCAIDVGANVGDSLAQICHRSNVPVLCVEPADEYYATLLQNIESVGIGTPVKALIAEHGSAADKRLVVNAGTARLVDAGAESSATATMSLDQLLDAYPQFRDADLLKIDTDGYDLDVLESGRNWIARQQPALFFEFDMTFGRATMSDGLAALERLAGVGYRYFLFFDNFGHLVHDLDRSSTSFDGALRYLRSNVTHGKVAYYFDVLALPASGAPAREALLAAYEARLADQAPPRIAVVRLDNLGDHVLGSGLFKALRAAYPKSPITAVVNEPVAGLYARCPYIDNLVALPERKAYLGSQGELNGIARHLAGLGGFDLVINPRFAEDYYLAGLFCRALAAPGGAVIGFRQVRTPYEKYDANSHFTRLIEGPETLHASAYTALLAEALELPSAEVTPQTWYAPEDLEAVTRRLGVKGPYIVVGCGASFTFKLPDDSVYSSLGNELASHPRWQIVVVGDARESSAAQALIDGIADNGRVVSAVGAMPLPELAALLGNAALFIGPDAGPKHMAAAEGTPVIELAWVPDDYPDDSRGPDTAGRAWSPVGAPSITIAPDSDVFWARRASPEFSQQRIAGLDAEKLALQVRALLEFSALQERAVA